MHSSQPKKEGEKKKRSFEGTRLVYGERKDKKGGLLWMAFFTENFVFNGVAKQGCYDYLNYLVGGFVKLSLFKYISVREG